jgi:hypothetical protein
LCWRVVFALLVGISGPGRAFLLVGAVSHVDVRVPMQQGTRALDAAAFLRSSWVASRGLCWRIGGRDGRVVVLLWHWLGNEGGARCSSLVTLRITTALRTCAAARLHPSE